MFTLLSWLLLAIIVLPVLCYFCVKLSTYAFLKARRQFEQDMKNPYPENNDESP